MTAGKTGQIFGKANVRGCMCIGLPYAEIRGERLLPVAAQEGTGEEGLEGIWQRNGI